MILTNHQSLLKSIKYWTCKIETCVSVSLNDCQGKVGAKGYFDYTYITIIYGMKCLILVIGKGKKTKQDKYTNPQSGTDCT